MQCTEEGRKGEQFHRNKKHASASLQTISSRTDPPHYLTFAPPPRKLSNVFFEKLEFRLEALLSPTFRSTDRSSLELLFVRKNRDEGEKERKETRETNLAAATWKELPFKSD